MKPHVLIADTERNYIFPLVFKLLKEYGDNVNFEILSDISKIEYFFKSLRKIDLLIIDEELLTDEVRPIIKHIDKQIILTDKKESSGNILDVCIHLYKYSSLDVLYNVLSSYCSEIILHKDNIKRGNTHIILVTSIYGGAGKSLVAYSLAKLLNQTGQKALYMDIEWSQNTDNYLYHSIRLDNEACRKLFGKSDSRMDEIKKMIEYGDGFYFLPGVNRPLITLNKSPEQLIDLARAIASEDMFRYIVIDSDASLDNCKLKLFDLCTEYIFVTEVQKAAESQLMMFFDNFDIRKENCYFICNRIPKEGIYEMEFLKEHGIQFLAKVPVIESSDPEKVRRVAMQTDFQSLAYLII